MNSSPADRESVTLPERIIEEKTTEFRDKFNLAPFMFSHNLVGHPLFEIPRLVKLANTIANIDQQKVWCLASNVPAHAKWSDMKLSEQVAEAIASIEESGSLVAIKSAHLDPDYGALIEQILTELEELTGVPLHKEITWAEAYVFISSPHSITPYHIDHESNFLFQIYGEKDVNLFDPFDRLVLTEQEIEYYFVGDLQAAEYKQQYQERANVYHLTPGKAVHHPSLAPHWVKNGNNYSVSLSINFCLRSIDLKARVYQVNRYLRQLGMQPTSPGKSIIKDRIKILLLGLLAKQKAERKDDVVFSSVRRIQALLNLISRSKK